MYLRGQTLLATRAWLAERLIADGFRIKVKTGAYWRHTRRGARLIENKNGERRLTGPDDSYYVEADITVAMMDYAAWLEARSAR
jgi:hypothetical protein